MGLPSVKTAFTFTFGAPTRIFSQEWVSPPTIAGSKLAERVHRDSLQPLTSSPIVLAGEFELRDWPFDLIDVGIDGGFKNDSGENKNDYFVKNVSVSAFIQRRQNINLQLALPIRVQFGAEYLFGRGFSFKDMDPHDISATRLWAGLVIGVEYVFMNKYPVSINFGCQFAPSSDLGYGFTTWGGLSGAVTFSVGYILGR